LDEVVASFSVSSAGVLSLLDYFQPYDYVSMDNADRDLGSSGTALLDGSVFNGNGVNRLAVVVGKPGKMYILNANSLGGFKQGIGGSDAVLQTIQLPGSVFGGVGSYPLEGGYIYVNPVGGYTYAYKLGHESSGSPIFSLAGSSQVNAAGRVGVGQMTVTSYKNQPGTGIVRTYFLADAYLHELILLLRCG
jgi:iron transport multicopper oxidase